MTQSTETTTSTTTEKIAIDLQTKEGRAQITSPPSVFYNPVQEFNRDLTIAVVRQFAREHFEAKLQNNSNGNGPRNESDEPAAKMAKTETSSQHNIPVVTSASVGSVGLSVENTDVEMAVDDRAIKTELDLRVGQVYEDGIRILEGLSATGLRSVRFALEVAGIKEVIANDFSQAAVEYIKRNITSNNVDHLVKPSYADAAMLLYQNRKVSDRYDVVDIDPYGSPSQFLDAAVQAVTDGGLLCVTCTDLATLCGNFPETCHSKYGAVSVKGKFCHEMALRIMLQSIEACANRYSRYIEPLISVSADFYIRMFMKVYSGQAQVKESITKLSMIYVCSGCGTYHLQPLGTKHKARSSREEDNNFKFTPALGPPITELCEHCGFKHHLAGPIWSAKIHNVDFVNRVLEKQTFDLGTEQRMRGMLAVISEELPEVPLYYITDELCRMMHCTPPTQIQIRSAILNACYSVSLSHAAKNSIKTTAPMGVIWDILRCWVNKTVPGGSARIKEGSVAFALRAKPPSIQADFTTRPDANPHSKKNKLKRYQLNPEPNWGPKARAGAGAESLEERREKGMAKAQLKAKRRKPRDLKRFACKKFKAGKCTLGDSCRYNHKVGPPGTGDASNVSTVPENEAADSQQATLEDNLGQGQPAGQGHSEHDIETTGTEYLELTADAGQGNLYSSF